MDKWHSTPSKGYTDIEAEFEASLRRAFVDGKADYIALNDRRQRFLWESSQFGMEKGWLTAGELLQLDEQSSEVRFRLTAAGKKHFGVK